LDNVWTWCKEAKSVVQLSKNLATASTAVKQQIELRFPSFGAETQDLDPGKENWGQWY